MPISSSPLRSIYDLAVSTGAHNLLTKIPYVGTLVNKAYNKGSIIGKAGRKITKSKPYQVIKRLLGIGSAMGLPIVGAAEKGMNWLESGLDMLSMLRKDNEMDAISRALGQPSYSPVAGSLTHLPKKYIQKAEEPFTQPQAQKNAVSQLIIPNQRFNDYVSAMY